MTAPFKVLVTGGSGFIGLATLKMLRSRGFEVVNLDLKPLNEEISGVRTVIADVVNREQLISVVRDVAPHAIIHLAAHADIVAEAWADFRSIHEGTANLLAAIDATDSVRRLVNVSTQLVIGPGHQPRSLLDYHPYTIYGEAKAYAEALVLQWQSQVSWVTVRPTNIWGPQHPSFAHAIWKYIADGRYMHPAGDPVLRTYGYVENTAHQLVEAMAAPDVRVARQTFYAGDAVMNSAVWVDAFAQALRGKPARRLPRTLLRILGRSGDVITKTGIRAPINSGRVLRMTVDYPTPIEPMLLLAGPGPIDFDVGVQNSALWLRNEFLNLNRR